MISRLPIQGHTHTHLDAHTYTCAHIPTHSSTNRSKFLLMPIFQARNTRNKNQSPKFPNNVSSNTLKKISCVVLNTGIQYGQMLSMLLTFNTKTVYLKHETYAETKQRKTRTGLPDRSSRISCHHCHCVQLCSSSQNLR